MYASRPPSPPAGAAGAGGAGAGGAGDAGGLRLCRASRRAFDGAAEVAADPEIRVFVSDLIRPYGLAFRDDLLQAGSGQSYGEMAEALLRVTVSADEPVDLLVLAFAIPDVRPGRSTAAYLSHVCPGSPLAFAVCDQGSAAAFTGLRLVREYARSGGCRRSLLVVEEQATLHYQPAAEPAAVPERHAGVALLFDRHGRAELAAPRLHPDVAPDRVPAVLAAEVADVAEVAAGAAGLALVLGEALAGRLGGDWPGRSWVDELRVAPAGQPYTGVWWELAGELPRWHAAGRLVVLADYDPGLGYLCVSTLDFTGPAGGAAEPVAAAAGQPVP